MIYFQTGPADYYLLRASTSTNESNEGEYSKVNYSANMTYMVQNGSVRSPSAQVDPIPHLYVNGKIVEADGIFIKNGLTYANASFIQEHIHATYSEEGSAALRTVAEGLGATVEYLPAFGDSRAAVLIYTKP